MNANLILIVDDTPANLQVLGTMLENAGYEVLVATNGTDTLIASRQTPAPKLILLDIMMPDMDGYEVCRRLKSNPVSAAIPVIFMSALDQPEQKVKAFAEGAVDYVTKPFEATEVVARVRTHMQLTRLDELTREVTERQNAEIALKVSEDRIRSLLRTAMDGFLRASRDGNILEVNDTYCRMSGYEPSSLLQLTIADLEALEDPAKVRANLERLAASGEDRFESRHRRRDGTEYDVEISAQIRRNEGDLVIFVRDISERKRDQIVQTRLEHQLQQSQRMESIGQLAGGVAHDFNNMLGVIQGHAEYALFDMPPDHPLRLNLEEILKTTRRSADLTRQLLAFARKQAVAPTVMEPGEAIQQLAKMLQRLVGEEIELILTGNPRPWSILVDPSQFDQILTNLCVNARDAIAGVGRIVLEIRNRQIDEQTSRTHSDLAPGEYVVLSVSDNGSGMDPETIQHIFEPFFTTKLLGKGTGLGLATVFGAVKQNRGSIEVASDPGKGSVFTIYFPRVQSTPIQAPPNPSVFPTGHETILLVEDDPAMLGMTKTLLEHHGYLVLCAETPSEALRITRERGSQIHLLLTDVIMPEMNGRDLKHALCALCPHLKYLYISGYPADIISNRGVLDEGVHFLQKPFTIAELTRKLREVLERDGDSEHSNC